MAGSIALAAVGLPPLDVPDVQPAIAGAEYDARIRALAERVEADRIVVYGDREHFANLAFFCGFDPRFEEALLVVGGGEARAAGGERGSLVCVARDRRRRRRPLPLALADGSGPEWRPAPRRCPRATRGSRAEQRRLGRLEGARAERVGARRRAIAAPAFIVDTRPPPDRTGRRSHRPDACRHRARRRSADVSSADQIAAFEWAAARSSRAVARVVLAARPGVTAQQAAGAMGYEGEPLSVHTMFSSGPEVAVGLRSPTARRSSSAMPRRLQSASGAGLCCRAGLVADAAPRIPRAPGHPVLERHRDVVRDRPARRLPAARSTRPSGRRSPARASARRSTQAT